MEWEVRGKRIRRRRREEKEVLGEKERLGWALVVKIRTNILTFPFSVS